MKTTLNLGYNYNKTYDTTHIELLGYSIDAIHSLSNLKIEKIAWIARYIFLKEDMAQLYFVPVSTCRYPNQVALLHVYPDFE